MGGKSAFIRHVSGMGVAGAAISLLHHARLCVCVYISRYLMFLNKSSAPKLPSSFSSSFNSGIMGGGGPVDFGAGAAEEFPNRKLARRFGG